MSIFGNIMSSIFGHAKAQSAQTSCCGTGHDFWSGIIEREQ